MLFQVKLNQLAELEFVQTHTLAGPMAIRRSVKAHGAKR